MKKIAFSAYDEFLEFTEDDDGFVDLPRDWLNDWRKKADSIEYPYGLNSLDATELWHFPDGSTLRVANPRQSWYRIDLTAHAEE